MKRTRKEFEKYVKALRAVTPSWSNGRNVVVLSEYSKKGQQILDKASRWEGNTLSQVYDYWSPAKEQAFIDAWLMYTNSRHGSSFGICSHNVNMFTVSWVSDDGVHFLTNKTEYLVVCNEDIRNEI